MKKRILSVLCCAALMVCLIPPASADFSVSLDFDNYSVGDRFLDNDDFDKQDLPEGGIVSRTVKKDGDKQYLEMSCQNTDQTTGVSRNRLRSKEKFGGTFTVEFDVNNISGTKLDVYLRTGGNIRVSMLADGTLMLQVLDAAKVPGVMSNTALNAKLAQGVWYTIKAEVTQSEIVLSAYDKEKDNALLGSVTLAQDASVLATLFAPYNIWFDMWGAADSTNTAPVCIGLDNVYITEGTYEGVKSEPVSGESSLTPAPEIPTGTKSLLVEDFEQFGAGDRIRKDGVYTTSDIPSGGIGNRVAAKSGGNTYFLASAWNTEESTAGARVQIKTVVQASGTYTLEWDYNNVTDKRGQYYDVYLRYGGNVRVRIMKDGTVRLLVLSGIAVPGVMEFKDSTYRLETKHWYTFKTTVSREKIVLEVYDKDAGSKLMGTMNIGQDASRYPQLFDAYPIWFDLWGDNDLTNLEPVAVAIDNINLYSGTYEGLRNSGIRTPAAAAVTGGSISDDMQEKENCPTRFMLDVPESAWYHDAVDYVIENRIMSGFNSFEFGPYDTLTRAMVVQVLYNKEGQPAVDVANKFTDVPAGQWYYNAVRWGADKGVVSGFGNGQFRPEDAVTLEQVAVILWNYAGNPAFTGTADGLGAHSSWASNALAWAIENGILADIPFESVTDAANRGQTAMMLMNFLDK